MARLFPPKPLVAALAVCFGATAYAAGDTPSESGAAETNAVKVSDGGSLSLGSTCLFCERDGIKTKTAEEFAQNIRRSGEEPLPPDYTRVTADDIRGQTQVGVHAEGDVIVERNDEILNAERVDYDQQTDTVVADGGYKLHQNGATVAGEKITYNLKEQTGESENVRLDADRDGKHIQSVSEKAEMKGKGLFKLINTKFNTCSPGDASWYIKAKSIEADQNTGIGVAKGASLVFGGVPIAYIRKAFFWCRTSDYEVKCLASQSLIK